ncbi:MAG: hypothetical protein HY698_10920 [Deltaproteobacteria bacterium]|nr:hypothetical protein [Deltaproteobacteria bacterium]
MVIVICEIHPAKAEGSLNEEWFVVENTGSKPFSTAGCTIGVGQGGAKSSRLKQLGTLDPGFTVAPGEKVRVVSGNPSKKAHGEPPQEDEGIRNYHLFLGSPIFSRRSTVIAMFLKQHELARATFEPTESSQHGA